MALLHAAPYVARAAVAACWGGHLKLLSRTLYDCEKCDKHASGCRWWADADTYQGLAENAPTHARLGGLHDVTGLYWDRCPLWYQRQPLAHLAARWARRWQPGVSQPTAAGDDLITIVRAIDRRVEKFVGSQNE